MNYINFKTDDNGNILLENGSLINLTEAESIQQDCRSRLRTKKGYWFLNRDLGLDVKNGTEKGGQNRLIYSMKEELLAVVGVVSIAKFEYSYDKDLRKITVSAILNTEAGQIYVDEVF